MSNNYKMDSFDHIILDATANENLHISRQYALVIFDSVIIPKSINLDNIKDIEIMMNGRAVFRLPFDLILDNSHNIKTIDNNYNITIPKELCNINASIDLLKNNFIIPLVRLIRSVCYFNLTTIDKNNFNYQIIIKKIRVDNDTLNKIIKPYMHYIDIHEYNTFINTKSIEFTEKSIINEIYIKLHSELIDYKLYINNVLYNDKYFWSSHHSNALHESLNNILPNELIDHIQNFFIEKNKKNNNYYYIYKIPFNNISIDNLKLSIKTIDDNYQGKIIIRNKNQLLFAGDNCYPSYNNIKTINDINCLSRFLEDETSEISQNYIVI